MRRLLTFDCQGAELAASLDPGEGQTGLLLVTGGSQTRVGSHRMYERLARSLAQHGYFCLRFDRRGVGDSGGDDPGFRASGPDVEAAAAALRREAPAVRHVLGFGLCDGATAIALSGGPARLDGLILVNPWLVEAESGEPPAAAVKAHYRQRLASLESWKRLFSGGVNYRKLLRGVLKIGRGEGGSVLAQQVASALARDRLPAQLILASRDATAIAAENEIKANVYGSLAADTQTIDTDSHTFARPGDEAALLEAVVEAVRRLEVRLPAGS